MMRRSVVGAIVGMLVVLGGVPAAAQTRSPWQMHHGTEVTPSNPHGLVQFSCTPAKHGDICEYSLATVPPEGHAGWASAPNELTIGYTLYPSRVCQAPTTCMAYGDYTYFQTFVNVPASTVVSTFTIAFTGMDDGSRVTIFNSLHPDGIVVAGSYVYLGGTTTANLAAYVKVGEINRVVITQVDDCCTYSRLESARVMLNGQEVGFGCEGNEDCDDGNSCTVDVCLPSGTCGHSALSCSNGQSCDPTPEPDPVPTLTGDDEASAMACPGSPTGPTLVVNGSLNMTLECGVDTWTDPGAEAWDVGCVSLPVRKYNSGQDAYGPGPNTCAEGTYSVQYIAWNAAGKTVSAIRSVKVDDTTPPTFTLKGPSHMVHQCGSQWVDPGWEASDACYGNIWREVRWTGFPNAWVEGTYTVTYTLTDSGGNSAPTLTRTVEVVNCPW
jgi:hypothetical protein